MSFHQDSVLYSPYLHATARGNTYDFNNRAAIAAILLLLGCLTLSLFDAWPSTTQRFLWESLVSLTPSRLLYSIEYAVMRYRNKIPDGARFAFEDFGSFQAKSDALQRIFHPDNNRFTATINRVRGFSGIGSMLKAPGRYLPSGLGNWDNSCYQNSIIQALSSMPAFRAYLDQEFDTAKEGLSGMSTRTALRSFTSKLSRNDNSEGVLWTPPVLKSMNSWQQQDAQEFFSKMMDALEKEDMNAFERNKAHMRGLELDGEKNLREEKRPVRSRNSFEGLLAQRVVCTQCGFTEGLPLLPFNCLTVNMGREHEYSIADLLDEHTALEEIEGVECTKCTLLQAKLQLEHWLSKTTLPDQDDERTHITNMHNTVQERLRTINGVFEQDNFSESGVLKKCNISAKSHISSIKTKQVVVARPPKSLVIHINRSIFDDFGNQRKNTAIVRFSAVLDFRRWCLGGIQRTPSDEEVEQWTSAATDSLLPSLSSIPPSSTVAYELRALVTHTGRHENGHYVAWAKRHSRTHDEDGNDLDLKPAQERWYCFNDEIVTEVSQAEVVSCGHAFMLFYEAVEVPREICWCEADSSSKSCNVKGHDSEATAEVIEPVNSAPGGEDLAVECAKDLAPAAVKPSPMEPANFRVLEEGAGLVMKELPPIASLRRPVAAIMRTSNESGVSPHGRRRKDNFSFSSASVVSAN